MTDATPLTLGTAGHVDHGKTRLVAALTGVDTDRLPEERARGLTIVLGYAPLQLPSGRRVSVIDVPGHERFVATMVSGATGIDAFLMIVAADDGVMPQTIEHVEVLRGLGVARGVVAVTKADLVDPTAAMSEAAELLPGCEVVSCSASTGLGLEDVRAALDRLVEGVPARAAAPGPTRLHIDRVFTVNGRGTVVAGTLWAGSIGKHDRLEVLPGGASIRVRGVQVHDAEVPRALAGQRVAVNLTGGRVRQIVRGDVLATPNVVRETRILDCALELREARHGEVVHVHHGTRDVRGRLAALAKGLWQVRLDAPVLALDGDRVVIRRIAPRETLGGGVVLDACAGRHGARPEIVERLRRLGAGETVPRAPGPVGPAAVRSGAISASEEAKALVENQLRGAGAALVSEQDLVEHRQTLRVLRDTGRAVRLSGRLYAHLDTEREIAGRVVRMIQRDGSVTLAAVRDELGLTRRTAQAFLDHLDAKRVTRRRPDDTRVLVHSRHNEDAS